MERERIATYFIDSRWTYLSSRCLSSSLTQKEKKREKNGEKISVFDLESGTDFN